MRTVTWSFAMPDPAAGANLTASWRLPYPSGANNILLLQCKTRVTDPRQRGVSGCRLNFGLLFQYGFSIM